MDTVDKVAQNDHDGVPVWCTRVRQFSEGRKGSFSSRVHLLVSAGRIASQAEVSHEVVCQYRSRRSVTSISLLN